MLSALSFSPSAILMFLNELVNIISKSSYGKSAAVSIAKIIITSLFIHFKGETVSQNHLRQIM